ncbi:lysophospholipase [Staphylococcus petrasii]|uniref:Alpha/beta fold hydrolase n=1 Tax=Staphylococcus petrasii TaxID=1276936 RepID=A0A380G1I2_9STAP|nr:alpha/beta hydrolase [Staphylococcus petrasii]PNZ25713.1 lysophospholipase [Staphylococcus petrasii]PNZ80148.1 lysophospholipase [Staphylococcus petrasii]TGA82639.1 alpha/beta fold hydrolase [Staphylococcus petrasii]TGE12442.1 alpha/beta fold hydrolase [Staphylococcus petrasii]TGE17243.1 alpha/beta fold hydrolase [Staphylococcus petrasii]
MGQNSYKITVEDGTTLEVKVDKAKIATFGVVHIFHGMAEHMDRYEALVQSLTQQGYDVIRHNHRGHGKDINEDERGHFDDMNIVVQDAYEIAQTLHSDKKDVPYIVLGHSMGSIIARLFVEKYPDIAQGLILTGTGLYPKWKGIPAVIGLKLITLFGGKRSRLKWVNQLVYKSFNKKIDQPETQSDWLSSKRDEVDKFVKDEYTGFLVSNQLIYQTVKNMMKTANYGQLKKMNPQLPILLISGKEDPFGDYGKGVRSLGRKFKTAGIKHITVQLYAHRRHEILFEEDEQMIWNHMFDWIQKQILNKSQSEG